MYIYITKCRSKDFEQQLFSKHKSQKPKQIALNNNNKQNKNLCNSCRRRKGK